MEVFGVSRLENVVLNYTVEGKEISRTITVRKFLWRHRDNGREMWLTAEVRPLPSNLLDPEKEDRWELVVEKGVS